jgi:hypothetical protein
LSFRGINVSEIFSEMVIGGPGDGTIIFIALILLQVIDTMKKVMSRNPRSTIGVRSTRVDNFLQRRANPFFPLAGETVSKDAITGFLIC